MFLPGKEIATRLIVHVSYTICVVFFLQVVSSVAFKQKIITYKSNTASCPCGIVFF